MDKMKKGDLEKFRKAFKPDHKGEIMISMGTCGIAAGGDTIYKIFEEELKSKGLESIKLKKTGCLGMCFCEPNLVVKLEGMPEILYGNVDEKAARSIVSEHVIKKNILNNYVIFMPSKDTGLNIFKD
ncbi:MAG: (2Fe-2S) ferredoxin domain-containing protein [bacterium]